jgi:probable lipoprotein (TIGR04455 family)
MKRAFIACTVIPVMLASFACSSVHRRFIVEGYKKNPAKMIKRIVITSDPFPQNGGLARLVSAMTRDLIRTNRNYLVYGILSTEHEVADACKTRDGVLKMSVAKADAVGERIDLEITGELRRCSDRSVVWSATARASGKSQNRSLRNLVQNYVEEHGKEAEVYAAPAFNVIEDIVEAMPNPDLTEEELMEKIELEISIAPGKDHLSIVGS